MIQWSQNTLASLINEWPKKEKTWSKFITTEPKSEPFIFYFVGNLDYIQMPS